MVMRSIVVCYILAMNVFTLSAEDVYDTTWKGKQVVLAATKDGITYAMNSANTGAQYDMILVRINSDGKIAYLTTASNHKNILWSLDGYSTGASIQSMSDRKYLYVYTKDATPKLSKISDSSAPSNYTPLKFDTKTRNTFYYKSGTTEWGILKFSSVFKLDYTSYISSQGYPIAKPYFLAEHTWRDLNPNPDYSFGTICLPKAVEAPDVAGATFYNITKKLVDDNKVFKGVVLEQETGDLVAGRPYIYKKTGDSKYIVAAMNGEAVEVAGSNNGLVGDLTGTIENGGFVVPAGMYIIQQDKLWLTTEGTSRMLAGRAYIDPSGIKKEITYSELPMVKGIVLEMEEGLQVGVEATREDTSAKSVFDLQGRRMTRPQQGRINIIGGRKVIIK